MQGRLRSIDVIRGLAASAVVLHHSGPGFEVGAIGVDFFFIVSGFVMAQVSQDRTAGQFLADRAWRIFPIYWAIVVPWLLINLVLGAIGPLFAMSSALLWPKMIGIPSGFLQVSWTLVYELAFYAAVAVAIRLHNPWFPAVLFVAAILLRPLTSNPLIGFIGSPIAIEFLFGVVIARSKSLPALGQALTVIGLLWLLTFPNSHLDNDVLAQGYGSGFERTVLWGIPAALIIYGLVSNEEAIRGRLVDALLVLGAASYSIYLTHTFITLRVALPWPLEFALGILAGLSVWALIERRLLKLRSRKKRGQRAGLPEAGPVPVKLPAGRR